jgi:hypothetical protein
MSRLWPSSGRRRPCAALDERSRSSYRHIHAHDGAHHKTGQASEPITKQFGFAVTCASATPQPRNIQPRLSMTKPALLGGCLRNICLGERFGSSASTGCRERRNTILANLPTQTNLRTLAA